MKSRNAKPHRGAGVLPAIKSVGGTPASRGLSRPARGLTLVEVLITMVIFITLAAFTIMAVKEVVTQWSLGERRRVAYEKAAGCIDVISNDIRLAMSHEPAGVTEIKAKFIADFDPETQQQRLMFVRTFESGPERAITFNAGDGQNNQMMFQAASDPSAAPVNQVYTPDVADFTGLRVGDFRALGGMAMIGYFVKNQTLYRVVRAPVPDLMSPLMVPQNGQILATDVLHLGFEYWSQYTQQWDEPAPRSKAVGPERLWDSTRAISVGPLKNFRLHRGEDSATDKEDDVFPEKVRITITVDSPMPRCVFTKLVDDIGESSGGEILVDSTQGFPDGGDENSYLLIDNEWMHYSKKTADSFVIDRRAVRGSKPAGHSANAIVRTGKTFRRVVYLPNWREDWTPDADWRARKEAQLNKPRTLVK
ncbi:MAG TPA: prepilin-type N-terminal cleavage/methylation domain-containing protein [Planctomycetota bacterium]|nr:prepilin-type N-terminal cleavage/methylation domain-containing protein [Planctomycetota bacterium]